VAAFAVVMLSWLVYDVVSGPGGALNVVDLTVYRDGGLIVRHARSTTRAPTRRCTTGAASARWR
jgi:hypothetical protein